MQDERSTTPGNLFSINKTEGKAISQASDFDGKRKEIHNGENPFSWKVISEKNISNHQINEVRLVNKDT